MLNKCANPSCNESFRYLYEGKLFRLEAGMGRGCEVVDAEYFWLCPKCCHDLSLGLGDESRVTPVQITSNTQNHQMQFLTLDRKEGMLLRPLQSFAPLAKNSRNRLRRRHYSD